MKFATAIAIFVLPTLTVAAFVSYDTIYDKGSTSLDSVACSDGSNGVENRGYKIFSDLPTFPYIGGAPSITGYNSPACGSCYRLSYTTLDGNKSAVITYLAIDAANDYNLSWMAMNNLTFGQAKHLGTVDAVITNLDPSACGL